MKKALLIVLLALASAALASVGTRRRGSGSDDALQDLSDSAKEAASKVSTTVKNALATTAASATGAIDRGNGEGEGRRRGTLTIGSAKGSRTHERIDGGSDRIWPTSTPLNAASSPRKARPSRTGSFPIRNREDLEGRGAFLLPRDRQGPGETVDQAIGSTSPTSLTVTQSSSTGIVNWSSFSVGQSHQVQFNNGSGATLNRVTGNVPSSINGLVSATGSVYLVNPSGVVVGPSGVVKTGGSFVASTLDVKDADFRAGGALTFSGYSNASVVNLGKIGSSKGDVVLIARQVRNDGSLTAHNGTAAMASGSEVVLSDGSLGNGKVLVRRPAQDGEIGNSGAIRAAEVELRANGGNIYALAGNTGRAITATGVANKGGRIFLTAEGGLVTVTQKVAARRLQSTLRRRAPEAPGCAARSAAAMSSSAPARSWSAAPSRPRAATRPVAPWW